MASVDIALVKPGSQKQLYGELSAFRLTAIEPPMWAALMAAYLRSQGYSVLLLDAAIENWSYEETAHHVADAEPLLAAIMVSGTNPSASTINMTGAETIVRHLKDLAPHINTLMAGLHPSALPERTLADSPVDFVCQGEGFATFPQLLDVLKAKGHLFVIPGLWYREDKEIRSNPRPPLLADLNKLPMPAWDLLPMKRYRAHNWHCLEDLDARSPYAAIYTSLGCPFRCSFCCINAIFGKPGIRYRSPELVIREIDFLVENFNMRNIKILDEMFAMNESHVNALCDFIIERGYDLNMWAYARVNTVNARMLNKMKRAGFNWLAYGFESGSEKVLKDVSKGFPTEMVSPVVKMTREEGINICANFMVGLPEDDRESMQATLDMAMEINAEWLNLQATMAFPGSKLYEIALEKGWPLPDTWQGYSQYAYDTLPLPTKHLTGPEVLAFRDDAFVRYVNNPDYLRMIADKFDPSAADHLREMVSHRIPRKYVIDRSEQSAADP